MKLTHRSANFSGGILSPDGRLAKDWWRWIIAALIPYCLLWVLIAIKREVLGNPDMNPDWYEACYSIVFVTFSAAVILAILAFFLRFMKAGRSVLDPLQHDAYGIFLVHYAFMLWLQYWLYDFNIHAIFKALIVFVLGLALSWGATAALRKIPGSNRVL